jgi:2-(1,2-epoxy-1,2-dihydrophenyl)acetyl-CoA isomerase
LSENSQCIDYSSNPGSNADFDAGPDTGTKNKDRERKRIVSDTVLVEKEGGIAAVTLNRPKALNALNQEVADALVAVLADLERDSDVRVVVVRGAGGTFMAGGDVKRFHEVASQGDPEKLRDLFNALISAVHRAILIMNRMPQPIIASVEGAVAGFGLSLAMAADLVVAAEGTRFTLAYSRIGTSPDGGSTYTLPRLVGSKKATEIALLSGVFDAAEAERLGLLNRVVPADSLEAETRKLAQRLARGPAYAHARTKALLRGSLATNLETQLQREQESFIDCCTTADFAEGVAAFVEKREGKFQGA